MAKQLTLSKFFSGVPQKRKTDNKEAKQKYGQNTMISYFIGYNWG